MKINKIRLKALDLALKYQKLSETKISDYALAELVKKFEQYILTGQF